MREYQAGGPESFSERITLCEALYRPAGLTSELALQQGLFLSLSPSRCSPQTATRSETLSHARLQNAPHILFLFFFPCCPTARREWLAFAVQSQVPSQDAPAGLWEKGKEIK